MRSCISNGDGLCVFCGLPCAAGCPVFFGEAEASIAGSAISASSPAPIPTSGPGTELSRLLKRLGIEPTPTCACRAKQQEMDLWGCDECERPERIDEVVDVMRAEATARGLPFLDIAGRLLIKRAISNARRNA